MAQTVFKRYEKKYLLSAEQESALLDKLSTRMELDKYGETTICNIYFDTDDFDLIRTSIQKPVYKEKLRLRSYGVPKDENSRVFVEIKKKYDGIVYKRREQLTLKEAESYLYDGVLPDKDSQIMREIDWFKNYYKVSPKVYLAYDRRAYAGLEDPDFRLTLDRNIRCRTDNLHLIEGSKGETILPQGTTLMELKIHGAMPLWMSDILSELKIYPVSISKYGTYYSQNADLYGMVLVNHSKEIADAKARAEKTVNLPIFGGNYV